MAYLQLIPIEFSGIYSNIHRISMFYTEIQISIYNVKTCPPPEYNRLISWIGISKGLGLLMDIEYEHRGRAWKFFRMDMLITIESFIQPSISFHYR